ncbi:MAG: hypothetical protein ABI240_01370 [Sphingomonas sp.]
MLARLILLLLLAAFTLPAMAASPCHDSSVPMAMPAHHSMPAIPARGDSGHDDRAIVAHACIGCIPPSSLRSGADIARPIESGEMRLVRFTRLDAGRALPPATPPPRSEA